MSDLRSSLGARGERVTLDLYRQRGFTLVAAGQAWRGDTLAAFAISEVYIDE